MKKILKALGRRLKREQKPTPLELHKLPWHPFFYKTLKMHIDSTTQINRF